MDRKEITVEKELSESELKALEHDFEAKTEAVRIVKALDKAVNLMDHHVFAEAFIEQLTHRTHRTLQQSIARLFLEAFVAWAEIADEGEGHYDLRNEGTVKLAQKIRDLTEEEGLPFV